MIYFIDHPGAARIKIGHSTRLSQRLAVLVSREQQVLVVMAVMDGGRETEKKLHAKFAHHALGSEWFSPGEDLLEFIARDGRPWDGKDEIPTTPVRLTDEAIKWARIASGYTGESMADYVSRITAERGKVDADKLHAEVTAPPKSGKPKGAKP